MILSKNDIKEIAVFMLDTEAESVEIKKDNSSGIGYALDVTVPIDYAGRRGKFTITLCEVDSW
jgi:hypothetical protein